VRSPEFKTPVPQKKKKEKKTPKKQSPSNTSRLFNKETVHQ
jgi:hypothetical protein